MRTRTIALLGLSCLLLSACRFSSEQYQGYVEVQNTYMAALYMGRLQHLDVVRGQWVKQGQRLFRLNPDPERFVLNTMKESLAQAKQTLDDLLAPKRLPEIDEIIAKIKQSEAQIHLAKLRVKRNQELLAQHVVPQDTLDEALERQDEAEQLKAQYEAQLALAHLGSRDHQILAQYANVQGLEISVKKAQWDVAQKTVYAPFDGFVFETYYTEGELVEAQHPILSLVIPRNIRIVFFVPAVVLPKIHLGQIIRVWDEDHQQSHPAQISYVSSEAEYVPPLVYSHENLDKLVFRIKASADEPMVFKPGEPVEVDLTPVRMASVHRAWSRVKSTWSHLRLGSVHAS